MAATRSVAQSFLDYNRGREPQRLRRKFKLLRQDPFAFFRGTRHLFFKQRQANQASCRVLAR